MMNAFANYYICKVGKLTYGQKYFTFFMFYPIDVLL